MYDPSYNPAPGCQLPEFEAIPDTSVEQLPPEKIKEMQDYAKKLVKNSPKMKPDRVKRKVAEKFKIKLV